MPQFIVRNFMCLKEVKIEVKGLTTIHGDSSAGKSALLKSIYAATHNRFKRGQVRNGEDFITVMVKWDRDGEVLKVIRRPDGSPIISIGKKMFSKISRTVPEDIINYNNLGLLRVSEEIYSLNFSSQFEKPLLLAFSQKKVMQILSASKGLADWNKVHTELATRREQNRGSFKTVDTMLSSVKLKVSEGKAKLRKNKDVIESLKLEYSNYVKVNEDLIALKELEKKINTLEYTNSRIDQLDYIKNTCVELNNVTDLHFNHVQLVSFLKTQDRWSSKKELLNSNIGSIKELIDVTNNLIAPTILKENILKYNKNQSIIKVINEHIDSLKDLVVTHSGLLNLISLRDYINKRSGYELRYISVSNIHKIATMILDRRGQLKDTKQLIDNSNNLKDQIVSKSKLSIKIESIENMIENKLCPVCSTKLNLTHDHE